MSGNSHVAMRCDEVRKIRMNQKKADVVERPKAFAHVGLLVNKPPGRAGLLFI